ncbi:hypothetical protein SAMN05661091_4931 [Paenibacillus uliginis N3/975]|uniref:Uncharacterized protein n=1 Tax=Paenibacillus uliginis N3/975 TaxID=1313296 RepID=A0A1X7HNZ3_9BACL|nr:hypothetical protein SAMN05661091_4931 [Paenibacillus uliginis N3/975]
MAVTIQNDLSVYIVIIHTLEKLVLSFTESNFSDKFIKLFIAIYSTNQSSHEIRRTLQISKPTYYRWRKQILLIFPQIEKKFSNRR